MGTGMHMCMGRGMGMGMDMGVAMGMGMGMWMGLGNGGGHVHGHVDGDGHGMGMGMEMGMRHGYGHADGYEAWIWTCGWGLDMRMSLGIGTAMHSGMRWIRSGVTASKTWPCALHTPLAASFAFFSSHKVVVVGIHLRANDTFVWQGKEGFGEPKVLSDGERGVLMAWAESYMACAERLEFWWMPPPTSVRWLVISNSQQLKEDLKLKYPDKVVASDILPVHANSLKSTIRPSSTHAARTSPPSPDQATRDTAASAYIDIVVEWLLLASTDALVLSYSGFSHMRLGQLLNVESVVCPCCRAAFVKSKIADL
ncbi:unnamed protein product [Closterium sp. NIES-53]